MSKSMKQAPRRGLPPSGPVSKSQVKQMIASALSNQQELKWFAFADSAIATDYGGFCSKVTQISQGDTDITRDGDSLALKAIDFRWTCVPGDSTNLVRCMLFQWFSADDVDVPSPSDILNVVGDVRAPISQLVSDRGIQFKVLYDETVAVDTYHPIHLSRKIHLDKFPQEKVKYIAGTTNGYGNIWKLFISDSAAATHPSVTSYGFVRFLDA